MSASVLTVSQVNGYIKMLLAGDGHLNNVFISGEISNFNNNYKSGHLYFSLKDDRSVIRAVMFSSSASRLRFCPADGMKVLVCGRVGVYEATGQYQVYVDSMQPEGVGALTVAYEQLKNKLAKEGLFDNEHKKPLPQFPKKIGVITSPTGAVLQDIKNVVSRRYPIAEIVLCPTAVQGEKAAAQLTKAVKRLSAVSDIDVIIIGRGGGSFEDLNCFNDENLVREIYKSEKPIISAVGHETDFTLCDFVSDVRAPTPSAAAELAVPNVVQVLGEFRETYLYMQNIVESRFDTELADIERLRTGISVKKAMDGLESDKDSIESIFQRIKGQVSNYISMEKLFTDNLADKISNLSPINTLKRGYACVTKNGSSVNGVYGVACGDRLNVHMSDGVIKCTVDEVKNG